MTLDELADAIAGTSNEPAVQRLSTLILDWKNDDTTVQDLRSRVERFIGNTWVNRDEDHKSIYAAWSNFAASEISSIQGMTMNERLYAFCLVQRFDETSTSEHRSRLYVKLLAKP